MYTMNGREFFDDYCQRKITNPENYIVMPKGDFVKEHHKLIGILDRKKPMELNKEKQEQSAEMKRYITKKK